MKLDQGLFTTKTWFTTSQAYSCKYNEDLVRMSLHHVGIFRKRAEKNTCTINHKHITENTIQYANTLRRSVGVVQGSMPKIAA